MSSLGGALTDLVRFTHTYGRLAEGIDPTWGGPAGPSGLGLGDLSSSRGSVPLTQNERRGWDFGRIQVNNPRDSSVLVLFGSLDRQPADYAASQVPEDLDVLLTQRSLNLRKHPGQVSFPGGAQDPDDAGPIECALREAEEETGVDPRGIQVVGSLPQVPLSVSSFLVTPVIGWWREPSQVAVMDEHEATRVFRVPVADLINPKNRVRTVVRRHTRHPFYAPAFMVSDTLVWGFTAILLDRTLDLLGWSQPWDQRRIICVDGWDATQPVPEIYWS